MRMRTRSKNGHHVRKRSVIVTRHVLALPVEAVPGERLRTKLRTDWGRGGSGTGMVSVGITCPSSLKPRKRGVRLLLVINEVEVDDVAEPSSPVSVSDTASMEAETYKRKAVITTRDDSKVESSPCKDISFTCLNPSEPCEMMMQTPNDEQTPQEDRNAVFTTRGDSKGESSPFEDNSFTCLNLSKPCEMKVQTPNDEQTPQDDREAVFTTRDCSKGETSPCKDNSFACLSPSKPCDKKMQTPHGDRSLVLLPPNVKPGDRLRLRIGRCGDTGDAKEESVFGFVCPSPLPHATPNGDRFLAVVHPNVC